ncbi:MAG: hypothetical protein Q9184_002923, partial [Pyrenodesmia sp. 2 TL-2023]
SPDTIRGDYPEVIDLDSIDDVIGLTEDDCMTEEEFNSTFLPDQQTERDHATTLDRNLALTQYMTVNSFSINGITYESGKTAELANGDFVQIAEILEEARSAAILLRGSLFRRTSKFRGLFDLHLNEVAMVMEHTEKKPLEAIPYLSSVTVPIAEAVRIREIVLTNEAYPMYSFKEDKKNRGLQRETARESCRLICRWKVLMVYRSEARREARVETCITRLRTQESDRNYRVREKHLREEWRGETVPGGRCQSWLPGERDFDVAEQRRNRGVDILGFHRQSAPYQGTIDLTANALPPLPARYTFGDAFCGAGGASRGAKAAGFRVDWAFDFDPAAIESYGKNFFATRCEITPADVFISSTDGNYVVEVLHISPPCQPFSPIHVHTGKDDEMNSSSLFAVGELLKKTKPRIVTLENTFGLAQERWKEWLNTMVQVFTNLGFSVRWRVLNLADYGLPQARPPGKRYHAFRNRPMDLDVSDMQQSTTLLEEYRTASHCMISLGRQSETHRRTTRICPFETV